MTVTNDQQPPRSVRFARRLLVVQAGCWGLPAVFCLLGLAGAAVHGEVTPVVVFSAVGSVFASLGIVKGLLARRLQPGSVKIRQAAIGVELAMTCFGAYVLLVTVVLAPSPAGVLLLLPFSIGTGLSLTSAIGLLRTPARRYTAWPASVPSSHEEPADAEDTDPASFWRLPAVRLNVPQRNLTAVGC